VTVIEEASMSDPGIPLHPPTEVLTRGFDPTLSVGSARPAVFRSSTYVFPSPEAAERAFDLMAGRAQRQPGEGVALVYSRFNHPNAEILEDQVAPLEPGATGALVFNSGMSAIVTALFGPGARSCTPCRSTVARRSSSRTCSSPGACAACRCAPATRPGSRPPCATRRTSASC
jgi:hypothetical protein